MIRSPITPASLSRRGAHLALITVTEAMGLELDDDTEWTITSAGKVRSTASLQLAPARAPSRARRPPA
eukprot:906250-Prymnesium_polylepis.1